MPQTIMRTNFKVKRSKVKVTRLITADTESVSYLRTGKAYDLIQNWYDLKIGRMEAHHKSNQRTYLEAKRSKVKVTRPINAQIN